MFSHIPAARWGEEEDGGSESSPRTAGECIILAGGGSPVLFQAVPRGAGGAEHPLQLRIWRQRRSRGAGGGLQGCSSSNKRLRRAPSCPGNSGCLPFPQLSPTSAGAPQLLSAHLGQRGFGREGTRRMGMTPWLDRRQQGGLVGRSDTSQAGPQLQGRPHPIPCRIPRCILRHNLCCTPCCILRCILHPTPHPV